ncbi:MAG: zinc-ribbon domain containing protein [Chloroflexi bacterium]|nr:zinc-ribbon domain containing protein [Chloroflexota bacterium]
MSFTDKSLSCRDCGVEFVFTAGEQEFFAARGFENEPSRCPACRASRRSSRPSGSYSSDRSYSSRSYREMHPAVCAECGVETQVPFVPRNDKPVYCSPCFDKVRGR